MKITDLSERVQVFHAIHNEEADGEFTITYKPGGWFWARITPKSYTEKGGRSQAETYQNRYEVVMHMHDVSHTGHAYVSRLGWKHKLLDIYTPWLETQCMSYVTGLATAKTGENNHG